MKNKNIICYIIFLILFNLTYLRANEPFDFNVTEIEITNEGNFFKGLKRGTAKTNNGETIITADTFEYDKNTNILNAKGNVIIEDKIKDYLIKSSDITYYKNIEEIFSKGKTEAFVQSKYEVFSSDVNVNRILNKLKSQNKTIIIDDEYTQYKTETIDYSIDKYIFKGTNINVITNTNSDDDNEKEFYFFKDGIFNLDKKDFIASDTKIYVKKNIFDDSDNDPRIYGVTSKKKDNITNINKAIFTSCKLTDNCPPWSIKATTIIHDQEKKDIIYKNPILRIYDFPVFYFPKFTHPDPTVRRRSGFLQPQLNNSDLTGSAFLIPYFHVLSETKDFTFKPSIFDSNIYMYQTEYRQKNQHSNFIADLGVTKGYQAPGENRNSIGHVFAKFTSDLNLSNFESSSLDLSFQKSTKDTFLKVFETNLIDLNKTIKPSDSLLKSDVNLYLNHENYDFNSGFIAYENLSGLSSDRYQYILPYYNFSNQLYQNSLLNFNFSSNGNNNLKETNKLESTVNNSLDINSIDFFSITGFKNNFQLYFKNLNSVGKNINTLKSSPQIQLYNIINLETSLPLVKYDNYFTNIITPRMSFRINPTDMNDAASSKRTLTADNIFNINRLGLDDFEEGRSLTLGIDYKKESIENINKFFEFKLAGVLRDVKQDNIPQSSSTNQRASNLFGLAKYNLSENINLDYSFSLDNDFNTLEQNSIGLGLSFIPISEEKKLFSTNFNFSESNGKMGNGNVLSNSTVINFDDNNYLTFETRRNREINFTEYYNLVYEYKNDCLVAGVKFNKSYYQDRDLKPKEELLFTITFFPITQYDQRVKESAWKGKNAIQNIWK
jgi:LPS-assembly protein